MATNDWLDDFGLHHRPFDPALLVVAIDEARQKFPGCMFGRSGNGIGNLCVYDQSGEYVGVLELGDSCTFCDFTGTEVQ